MSLGLCWDINTDIQTFPFKVAITDKPYTHRGVLSVVNSVFDPLGQAAPVIIRAADNLAAAAARALQWSPGVGRSSV